MAYKATVSVGCPQHKGFSPREGQGAIKAGCDDCWRVLEVYRLIQKAEAIVQCYPAIDRRKKKKSKEAVA